MKEDEFVFFHGIANENGYLSNWYPCRFTVDGVTFTSNEQYMMYQKAVLFGDTVIAKKILLVDSPAQIKKLGRQVENFDGGVWDKHKVQIVEDGCYAKFSQNEELREKLLATGNKEIAECAVRDRIWGNFAVCKSKNS